MPQSCIEISVYAKLFICILLYREECIITKWYKAIEVLLLIFIIELTLNSPNGELTVYSIITTHISDNAKITKLATMKDINFNKKKKLNKPSATALRVIPAVKKKHCSKPTKTKIS